MTENRREKDWCHSRSQLSLRSNLVNDGADNKKRPEAEEEVKSCVLSLWLALSPPESMQQHEVNMKPTMQFMRADCSKKAGLGPSALDLTMSMRALEWVLVSGTSRFGWTVERWWPEFIWNHNSPVKGTGDSIFIKVMKIYSLNILEWHACSC